MATETATTDKNFIYHVNKFKEQPVGQRRLTFGLRHCLDFLLLSEYIHRVGQTREVYYVVKFVTRSVFVSERENIRASCEYFLEDQLELAVRAFMQRKYNENPEKPSGLGMSRAEFVAKLDLS